MAAVSLLSSGPCLPTLPLLPPTQNGFTPLSMFDGVSSQTYPQRPVRTRFRTKCSVSAQAPSPEKNEDIFKVEYTPWMIVGLGNPGNKYHGTRHNVGFEFIDSLSETEGVVMNTIQSKALVGIGSIGEVPILLVKPQAYMNYSGEAVGPLAAYYQVPLRHILLVYDEMNLPNGVLRLQPKAGHGYHNGVKSVVGHLDGRRDFPRLCIGIGNPPGTMDMKAFLLQKFSTVERHQIDAALGQGVEAVRMLVLNGFDPNITSFNLKQKYKFHQAIFDLENTNRELKSELKDLYINSAVQVDVSGSRKAVVVHVPFRLRKAYRKIHVRLVRELEKKYSGKDVILIATRRIVRPPKKGFAAQRPRTRTLTAVHEAMLEDVVAPAVIVGKRIRYRLDGSKVMKVFLDPKERNNTESGELFSSVS